MDSPLEGRTRSTASHAIFPAIEVGEVGGWGTISPGITDLKELQDSKAFERKRKMDCKDVRRAKKGRIERKRV